MANSQSNFQAALPFHLKWSVSKNQFDDTGKNPLVLSVFVPAESAFALAQFILDTAENPDKAKTAIVWDYSKNEEVEVTGFWINGRGRPSRDGNGTSYGNINPVKAASPVKNLKAEDVF